MISPPEGQQPNLDELAKQRTEQAIAANREILHSVANGTPEAELVLFSQIHGFSDSEHPLDVTTEDLHTRKVKRAAIKAINGIDITSQKSNHTDSATDIQEGFEVKAITNWRVYRGVYEGRPVFLVSEHKTVYDPDTPELLPASHRFRYTSTLKVYAKYPIIEKQTS